MVDFTGYVGSLDALRDAMEGVKYFCRQEELLNVQNLSATLENINFHRISGGDAQGNSLTE